LITYLKSINTKKFKDSRILKINASSSCFCYNDIFIQIEKRLKSFYGLNNFELNKYLNEIEKFYFLLSNNLHYIKYRKFPKKELILSPSDLSLKNFIINNKNVYFIDYEYFGLDNAIKLLCDTILHPNNKFSKSQSLYFFKNYKHFIKINVDRFKKCFYLYGLIWCLIILNPLKTGNGNSLIINKSKKFFYSLKKKYTQRYLDEITKI
jgi:hypothetical protein